MQQFMSIREAAEKWGVSERRVNQFCTEGRIAGAQRMGRSWMIPGDAEKPEDPRKLKKHQSEENGEAMAEVLSRFMPLLNTPFRPGTCRKTIRALEDGPRKDIAWAEYYYFSGQAEKAALYAEKYLDDEDGAVRMSACFIYAYACLTMGRTEHSYATLGKIKEALEKRKDEMPQVSIMESFVAFGSVVLLHLPLPDEIPQVVEFLPMLPSGVRSFALYIQAHYLYLKEEYEQSVGIVEATLAMGAEQYPIAAIYLHLIAVMDYMSLKKPEYAQMHMLRAWETARPDDLIEGFGEHHGLLGGMLEAVIKPEWPDDFRRIIDITYRFSAGWRRVHNPITGNDVADNLTTTEFAIAMLAARGWTNQDIADHLNISINTAKHHISEAMKKLDVKSRKDLKKHMLK